MGRKKEITNFTLTQEFLNHVAGPYSLDVVKNCLRKNGRLVDEEIGRKIKQLKITEIRTILNQLHYRGIAAYNKTKDKNSGWYTYTWEIKKKRIAELIVEQQLENVQKLESTLAFEKGHEFFSCEKKCEEIAFEIAAEYEFKCPECGGIMAPHNNKEKIKTIQKQIHSIKTELKEIEKTI